MFRQTLLLSLSVWLCVGCSQASLGWPGSLRLKHSHTEAGNCSNCWNVEQLSRRPVHKSQSFTTTIYSSEVNHIMVRCWCRFWNGWKQNEINIQTEWDIRQRYLLTEDFSSNLCVQTRSEAHPPSCTVDTGGPFPGQSAAGAWRWPLTPSSVEVKNE
jgi:hypothetical protein